jgi:serine/threonine-protein kinase HipA
MATKAFRRRDLEVHLGSSGLVVGRLYLGSGKRSAFSYEERWLRDARFFSLSPDLLPVLSIQHPQEAFFRALEDTAPDSWGERVIRRAHARLRQQDRETPALEPVDFLMWVDDEARIGALRLFDPQAQVYLRSGGTYGHVPPLLELDKVMHAARALEAGTETAQDLQYLLGQVLQPGGPAGRHTWRGAGHAPRLQGRHQGGGGACGIGQQGGSRLHRTREPSGCSP